MMMEWPGRVTWGTMSSPPSLTITLVTGAMGGWSITGDTATTTGRCHTTGNRNTWVSMEGGLSNGLISVINNTVSQRNSFPDKTICAHLRLFYPSSHVNQSMSWCNDGFLLDQGLRPTWAAIIRWQIVDQGRVTGEGSEREMGFINSEPSLQEFMPHQLDSADNTPPPTGIKIIKTNKKNGLHDNLHTLESRSIVYCCRIWRTWPYGRHGGDGDVPPGDDVHARAVSLDEGEEVFTETNGTR